VIRIVFELAILAGIVAGVLYLARQWDNQRRSVSGVPSAIEAPPGARWRAIHTGTADERTEVQIVLRGGDLDPDYDRLLFNALEDARSRAALLNNLREE
jgi:hypothetical protein